MPDLRFTPQEFERACSLLPEGTMWGDRLNVETVLHIAQASRREALEEAVSVVSDHQRAGREWVTGSLWDTLTNECAGRIRAIATVDTQ
jgi:hypothetical protein